MMKLKLVKGKDTEEACFAKNVTINFEYDSYGKISLK